MSIFEISEISQRISTRYNISVKRLDEKWKNFPPAIFVNICRDKIESYIKAEIRLDDIFILGYPRSGTSRLQELVWIIANDCDFDTLLEYDADARCINFEIPEWSFKWREKPYAKSAEDMPSPRLIKTHLPVQLLPDQIWTKQPKLIFISRDVKDVAISQYHLPGKRDPPVLLEDFLDDFLDDRMVHGPYREYVWNLKNLPDYPNIIYFTYEEMSANLEAAIERVAKFLAKNISSENVEKIKNYLNFDNMKNRKTNNNISTYKLMKKDHPPSRKPTSDCEFIRKGVVGGYKDEMPQEYIEKFDKWFAESGNLKQGFNYE